MSDQTMSDREKDLTLLETFASSKRRSQTSFVLIVSCFAITFALSTVSSFLGNQISILVACLSVISAAFIIMQHNVIGPLVREIQRLRSELEPFRLPDDMLRLRQRREEMEEGKVVATERDTMIEYGNTEVI